jgi:tRNA (adenine58-N1)-methyltransferase non-catalytic subunit
VSLGKYGSFRANQILGRPYHLTFEILDRSDVQDGRELRVVTAAELHAAELVEQAETDELSTPQAEAEEAASPAPQQSKSKSNVNTHDDPTNQKLTAAEIESLKLSSTGSGKELIDKILQSHSTLDQKTAFSLAKYTLRKHKKYMKRFTVLPLDVAMLVDCLFENREFARILEMRNESLGLVGCWANVHAAGGDETLYATVEPSSRYLIVDDTGGLVVAGMAEKMGILHPGTLEAENTPDIKEDDAEENDEPINNGTTRSQQRRKPPAAMSATSNSITLVHANQQPNLGLLRYFNYDSATPTSSHPLYTHLKTLSWLQLIDPASDLAYQEPTLISDEDLFTMKSNKRAAYFRKRKRWERIKGVIDDTRSGGFNGLLVASFTNPTSILRHLVPLLAGGSQVVVYSPQVEPLTELADYYSTARRTAFVGTPVGERVIPSEDFPVDPTLLLTPMVQTARVRRWQVLPGRTHPLMTGRGGAEGYIFVATRVIPAEGKVEARGRPPRGKKVKPEEAIELDARSVTEKHSPSPLMESQQLPTKKAKIEEPDNELEAQKAADREQLDRTGQKGDSPVGESEALEVIEQELEDEEVPVLGPATEALNEDNAEKLDVQMSIEK